nr:hypothetical protein [Tanacetum cinerariifolium]
QQNHLQPDAATQGDAHESPTLQLVPLMPCSLGVASSGIFRGGVLASGIPALRLVDGGRYRGWIWSDKNPGGRRDVGVSPSAGTKSSGCSNSGTNTGTWSLVEYGYPGRVTSMINNTRHIRTTWI